MKRFPAAILMTALVLLGGEVVPANPQPEQAAQVAGQGPGSVVRTADARTRLQTTLGRFIAQNPLCREITDSCSYCVVEDGKASCSTPGIACIKADYVCSGSEPR